MSAQPYRVAAGFEIDVTREWVAEVNGRRIVGHPGDTLASALLANGERVLARSFKYHRPRGLLGSWTEEPSALFNVRCGDRFETNVRATEWPFIDGLVARSVNCWPSPKFDVLSVLGAFAGLLPAGFYYKTFMWPRWTFFEPAIRRLAGLGRLRESVDPVRYEPRHATSDVLIVGGGPAGRAAARAAAASGASVLLLDDRVSSRESVEELREPLHHDVTILSRTTALHLDRAGHVVAHERVDDHGTDGLHERLWHISARAAVLATGAIERPLLFPDNDRPGVMLASAALDYLRRYGVICARRPVIVTADDTAYQVAAALARAGHPPVAILDARSDVAEGLCQIPGVPVVAGATITGVRVASGVVCGVTFSTAAGRNAPRGDLDCDGLFMAGGWTPALQLLACAGARIGVSPSSGALEGLDGPDNVFVCGAANSCRGDQESELDGWNAGECAAARALGRGMPERRVPQRASIVAIRHDGSRPGRQWVDYQNDVTVADVQLAVREGYVNIEHLKRYTTLGMAIDQGRTSQLNAVGLLAQSAGAELASLGPSRWRPPVTPVPFGALAAGRRDLLHAPLRVLPAHAHHVACGARFEEHGGWWRPSAYVRTGETFDAAVRREARTVRATVGVMDASPLGKIEVRGPDAAEFLDRVYLQTMGTLKVGRIRYGLMLNERGFIIDDGIAARLSDDVFHVGTTSGGVARVMANFEEWLQLDWPDLRVLVTDVSAAWGVVTVTGPTARTLLERLGGDIDLGVDAFPHLAWREGRVGDWPARVFRVSYTGEPSYEINVRRPLTAALWARCLEAGHDLGAEPFGIDALMTLRTEKGYLHVGSDTDSSTMPADVGFGQVIARKTKDFIGRRSLLLPEAHRHDRPQLVGLRSVDPADPLVVGAHVLGQGEPARHLPSHGWVSSAYFSPALGRWVALARIRGGRDRIGERVEVYDDGRRIGTQIVSPVAFDPEGARVVA